MATAPQFAVTPKTSIASIGTANTALDGSGTMVIAATGGTNGTRIDNIMIRATNNTGAGLINFFISDTTGANTTINTHLVYSVPVTSIITSATTAAFSAYLSSVINTDVMPMFLPSGYTLRVAPTQSNTFRVTVVGSDF